MTEEEIEVVAEELAKAGGLSWYPGREKNTMMKVVSDRYRERARVAIEALERLRASKEASQPQSSRPSDQHPANDRPRPFPDNDVSTDIKPGSTVIYRPPGDRRAYSCRIVEVQGNRAYLAPILRACTDWVSIEHLMPSQPDSGKVIARD